MVCTGNIFLALVYWCAQENREVLFLGISFFICLSVNYFFLEFKIGFILINWFFSKVVVSPDLVLCIPNLILLSSLSKPSTLLFTVKCLFCLYWLEKSCKTCLDSTSDSWISPTTSLSKS